MANHTYRVSSPEGAAWAGVDEGEEVERDLDKEQETALVAAGWLERSEPKKASK